MSQVESNGIHHESWGSGPLVVLLHGIASSLYDWRYLGGFLASKGYQAVAADLPGHGDSVKPATPSLYSASTVFTRTARWIDEIAPPEGIILVGHSLGGYLALQYARCCQSNIRALILVAPYYTPAQVAPVLLRLNRRPAFSAMALRYSPAWLVWLALGTDRQRSRYMTPEMRRRIARDYKRTSPYITYTAHTLDDLSPHLRQVSTPTLVLWGEKDRTLKPGFFSPLVSALPNASGQSTYDCGHQPHITQPDWVNSSVFEFLQSRNGSVGSV